VRVSWDLPQQTQQQQTQQQQQQQQQHRFHRVQAMRALPQQTPPAATANAQLSEQQLNILRMQAKAAKSGGAYARPGEVFSASHLEAIKTGVSPYSGSASAEHIKGQEGITGLTVHLMTLRPVPVLAQAVAEIVSHALPAPMHGALWCTVHTAY
jgi:hypothetical protein